MHFGIHLPHAGDRATPALIRRVADPRRGSGNRRFWVSEHIIFPDPFSRRSRFYDPVLTLTWAAAVTERVQLGTTVLVLPMRHPLPLAKELATLQNLSDGRLILGAGFGWLQASSPRSACRSTSAAAHGRGHRDDARGVEQGPGDLQEPIHPGRDRRDDDDRRCRSADPAVDWRQSPTPR